MALFVFVGDPRYGGEGAENIEVMGLAFNRAEPTFVDDESFLCQKLRGNNHFKEITQAEKRARTRTGQTTEVLPQSAQEE